MFRLAFTLVLLGIFSSTAWADMSTPADKQNLINQNTLENPGFESGKVRWTNTAGTFATTTTAGNVGEGVTAASFDASAASQKLQSSLVAIPAGLYGAECELRFSYKGGDANLSMKVLDGSAAVLATSALTTSAAYRMKQARFKCPSSGSFRVSLESTADAAIVYLDSLYLGSVVASSVVATPVVYEEERDVGVVGKVATTKGPLTDDVFPVPANVRYWHLAGDSLEKSGNTDINLTQNGTPEFKSTGFFGRSNVIGFNGSTQYLNSADAFFDVTTQDVAFGGWFKFENLADGASQALFSKWESAGQRSYLLYKDSSGGILLVLSSTGTTDTHSVYISPLSSAYNKTWIHVAAVIDNTGNIAKIYLNGQLAASTAFAVNLFDSSADFKIGSFNNANSLFLNALAQDVFFYKGGTLTDAQINAIASKRFSNHKQIAGGHELTAESFPFSDLTGKVSFWNIKDASDGSVNANTFTVAGTPVYTGLDLFGNATTAYSDGIDDRWSSTSSMLASDEVSMGAWFYRRAWTGLTTEEYFLSTSLNNTNRSITCSLEAASYADVIFCRVTPDGTGASQTSILFPTTGMSPGWHHIALTHKGTNTKIFVDGVVVVEGVTSKAFKTSGAFTVNDFFPGSATSPWEGQIGPVFFSKVALADEDILKIASAKVDLPNAVPATSQDWSASGYKREDSQVVNQLGASSIVDVRNTAMYLRTGLGPNATVNLKLQNVGMSGYNAQAEIFDTGELSSAPTFPLAHGLGRVPPTFFVLAEGESSAGLWDKRIDLCSVDAVNISCDLSPLGTINGTNRIRVVASGVAAGGFFNEASALDSGIVNTTTQTFAGQKRFGNSNSFVQTNAPISVRTTDNSLPNAFEWGHANSAGYNYTLGTSLGSGAGHICFNCEVGSTSNTFRTRGLPGSMIQGVNGTTIFNNVTTANADNQTPVQTGQISQTGAWTIGASGSTQTHYIRGSHVQAVSNQGPNVQAATIASAGKANLANNGTLAITWDPSAIHGFGIALITSGAVSNMNQRTVCAYLMNLRTAGGGQTSLGCNSQGTALAWGFQSYQSNGFTIINSSGVEVNMSIVFYGGLGY